MTRRKDEKGLINQLYQQIGQLKVEKDFLEKGLESLGVEQRRAVVDRRRPSLSVARQCQLLDISRSGLYYQPAGVSDE